MAKRQRRKAAQRKNNNRLLLWGVVAALVLGLAAVWFIPQRTAGTSHLPQEISVAEAVAKREAGAFILDVRQPDEWNQFHIPDSTLIPLEELASRLNEVPQNREVVVVCRTGHRSAQGRDILLQAGFTQVTSMAGGLTQWRAAGYPTVSGQ
jgi:rhodanese-related sulfurtransferase